MTNMTNMTNIKNVNAIDKIISRLSYRDYMAEQKKHKGKHKKSYPYSLGSDTIDAINIKKDYMADKINEEEYKAWCLTHNLTNKDLYVGEEYEMWLKYGA